ncbi:recombination protein RecR [bacterium]|nr:recombination protein RecR [bacterium]
MISQGETFESLVRALSLLPGIGIRTAQRLVPAMVRWDDEKRTAFLDGLSPLRDLTICRQCGFLTDDSDCRICQDGMGATRFAIVSHPQDVLALEAAGLTDVAFHCLGGLVSPGKGQDEDALLLDALVQRIDENIQEVILAFGPGLEADLTTDAISRRLPQTPLTRLATGLPVGADLSHSDVLTIRRSLEGRTKYE